MDEEVFYIDVESLSSREWEIEREPCDTHVNVSDFMRVQRHARSIRDVNHKATLRRVNVSFEWMVH